MLNEPTTILSNDDRLQLMRQDIRKYIKTAFDANRHNYDLRSRARDFAVGQMVYRRNFAQSCFEKSFNAKLAPVFIKAKVKEKLGKHYYILEDTDGKSSGTYHAKDIRT